jgi:hypothetical protein
MMQCGMRKPNTTKHRIAREKNRSRAVCSRGEKNNWVIGLRDYLIHRILAMVCHEIGTDISKVCVVPENLDI